MRPGRPARPPFRRGRARRARLGRSPSPRCVMSAMPSMAPRFDGTRARTRASSSRASRVRCRRRRRSPNEELAVRGSRRMRLSQDARAPRVFTSRGRSRRARARESRSERPGESLRAFSYSGSARRRIPATSHSRLRAHDTHPPAPERERRTWQPAALAPPVRRGNGVGVEQRQHGGDLSPATAKAGSRATACS